MARAQGQGTGAAGHRGTVLLCQIRMHGEEGAKEGARRNAKETKKEE